MNKVIFLDIDGVLITLQSPSTIQPDPLCVKRLNRLTQETQAGIVVTSTWRKMGYHRVKQQLATWGVLGDVVDVTPDMSSRLIPGTKGGVERGDEIAEWLHHHPNVTQFVILDDDKDMGVLMPYLIQTDWQHGLTDTHVETAVRMLQRG